MVSACEDWIMNRARHDVSLVPGNYRAALLQFVSQDVGDLTQNLTYNFRHREETLKPELCKLLKYAWRKESSGLLKSFKDNFNLWDNSFVPRILSTLFHQSCDSVLHHPLVVEFVLYQFFRNSGNNSFSMISCGSNASLGAVVLSLFRTGVFSLIYSFQNGVDQLGPMVVRRTQLCRAANILSPCIRRLREMQRRKKKKRHVTIDDWAHCG